MSTNAEIKLSEINILNTLNTSNDISHIISKEKNMANKTADKCGINKISVNKTNTKISITKSKANNKNNIIKVNTTEVSSVNNIIEDIITDSIITHDNVVSNDGNSDDNNNDNNIDPNCAFTEYFTSKEIRIAGDTFNPLFLAVDIARRIDDKNHNAVIKNYPPNYVVKMFHKDFPNQTNGVNFLTEKGLYRYLLRSESKKAEPFQEWVYDQLTTLRKRLVSDAELNAKIANDKLTIAYTDLEAANDIIDAVAIGVYDDTRVDSCARGMSEYYIGRFLIQYKDYRGKKTRADIPEYISEGLYLIASKMYQRDEQIKFYEIVEDVLCNHYGID